MYLKRAIIENSGPLRRLDLTLEFGADSIPKPVVLVGANGGGKTNFLSLVTDAIFEGAANHYENVLPAKGLNRAWFRIVGGRTTTIGASGGFSMLQFEDAGQSIIYKEKGGTVDPTDAAQRLPQELAGAANWPQEGPVKEISLEETKARAIFEQGVYAYFPASRSEVPYWLNQEALPQAQFEVTKRFSTQLGKPLFVERSLDPLKQWLMSVILEARTHISVNLNAGPQPQFQLTGNVGDTLLSAAALEQCNLVLRKVLADDAVRFVWLGRKSPDKLAIAKGDTLFLPNLDALSGGQSVLLGLFGTLLRYGDQSRSGSALDLRAIEGICIVDEIDAHLHVDLQHRILPALIKLFPRIQFIVSSHSPLFVLGMEKGIWGRRISIVGNAGWESGDSRDLFRIWQGNGRPYCHRSI